MIVDMNDDRQDHRKITVNWPRDANGNVYTIHTWVKTLSVEEQEEWEQLTNEHEAMVNRAIAVGDAWTEKKLDGELINWKSSEVHDLHWKSIPQEHHTAYLNFWHRFRDQFNDPTWKS